MGNRSQKKVVTEGNTVSIISKRGPLIFDLEDYEEYIQHWYISTMPVYGGQDRGVQYVYPIIYSSRSGGLRVKHLAARYIMDQRVGVRDDEEVVHLNEVSRDCRKKNLLIVPKGYRGHLEHGCGRGKKIGCHHAPVAESRPV